MQDIVNSALENAEAEQRDMDADLDGDGAEFGDPRIVIVGCGGAGNNTVNRLYNIGVDGAETIAINTDKQHLQMVEADTKILVGKSLTNGLGAGGDPAMGERATEMAQGTIKEVLGEADLVFVTAGMGGGTGTGAAPVVSKIAKEQGSIVVGALDVERRRDHAHDDGALLFGDFRDDRRRAGAGAAAHARGDEHEVGLAEDLLDGALGHLRGALAHRGVAAGPESVG